MYRNHAPNHSFRQVWRRRTGWGVLLASLILFCGCSAPRSSTTSPPATARTAASVARSSPSSAATSGPPSPAVAARLVATKRLANSEQDLTIESPALRGQVKVRLLLPAHYESQKSRLWPVPYLLHGCGDSYVSWTRSSVVGVLVTRRVLGERPHPDGLSDLGGGGDFHDTLVQVELIR
jgi:hypothetical protein